MKWTLLLFWMIYLLSESYALPPLGLTQIDPTYGSMEIIDGTAYISAPGGIQTVGSSGDLGFIGVTHPTLSPLFYTTRVVKANDGDLYVAASYGDVFNPLGGSLFRVAEPATPIVTWEGNNRLQGIDRELRGFGNGTPSRFGNTEASRFLLDGTIEPLAYPPGSDSTDNFTRLRSVTPNGYAIGDAGIPGTLGQGPAIWSPTGEFSFLDSAYGSSSIRDREDGNGVNAGWDDPAVKYGADARIHIKNNLGTSLGDYRVLVSQGDFVALSPPYLGGTPFGFYPGIDPAHPDRAVLLLDIFPELATIDIDFISDLASADGFVYMTLQGDDGAFLFGARDPSVVPEPSTFVLAFVLIFVLARHHRFGRAACNC